MNYKNFSFLLMGYLLLIAACQSDTEKISDAPPEKTVNPAAYSIAGEPLFAPEPSEENLDKFNLAKQKYEANPNNADSIIWYGRRAGYLTEYEKAINIFSEGVAKFPNDPRMYRHRGHRFISIRQFDKAIRDFVKAVELINGKANEIEPDGMPNAQNIPISTLHGNIWYHLGLAHYLQHDFENALIAYTNCRNTGSNDDNIVSSTHWLFMILNRLDRKEEAQKVLDMIHPEMNIVENHAYYQLCLFYKGVIDMETLKGGTGDASANDAVLYGIANWYYYNDDRENALATYKKILARDSWNSFGYIAAEVDAEKLNFVVNSGKPSE